MTNPLGNSDGAVFSEKPRILQRGAWTQAAPYKEEQFHRRVSDSIGNSYSPAARDLSTYFIYKLLGSNDTLEHSQDREGPTREREWQVVAPPCRHANRVLKKREPKHSLQARRLEAPGAVGSGERLISDAATWGSDYHPEGLGCCFSPPPPPLLVPRMPVCEEELRRASRLPPLQRAPDESLRVPRRGMNQAPGRLKRDHPPHVGCLQDRDPDSEEDHPVHDDATRAALAIYFPPSTFSTHGLSRPASPQQAHLPRYWELIAHSFDPSEVTPLCEQWLAGIRSRIPAELAAKQGAALQALREEVESVYAQAMKKSILDYILLDPAEQARLGITLTAKPSHSAGRECFPWQERVQHGRSRLMGALYPTHPVMARILHSFHSKYKHFRLLDLQALSRELPLTIDQLTDHMTELVGRRAGLLRESWLRDSAHIVSESRDCIEAWMPQEEALRMRKMAHFFGSVATLMSVMLRMVVTESLQELVSWLEGYSRGNEYQGGYPHHSLGLPIKPHAIVMFMKLSWEKADVSFTPSIDEVTRCLHSVVDNLVLSVQRFPRIEHQLFQAVDKLQIRFISSVQTGEEIVLLAKARIRAVIINNSHGPQRYCSVYQPSLSLLCAEAESQVEEFVSKEPNLCSYTREIKRFQGLGEELSSLPVHVPMELLLLDCSQIKQWMVQRTHQLASIFISRVASSSEQLNRSICQQYEDIVSRITTISGSTSTLVELQGYVDKLWGGDLLQLKEKLELAAANLLFLLDFAALSKEDVILNGNTFSWPDRIVPIIKNSEIRLQKEHDQAVQRLGQRQGEFSRCLAEVALLVKEFQRRERLAEAQQYVERLRDIGLTIQGFIEEKSQINQEEALLGMGQVSPYPEIEELLISKEPFDRLWAAALSFNTQQERWLNGALLQVSAEEVEEQVQSLWKTSYKLTKVLHHPDLHGPLKAATTIKTKLDKFRINMPLIKALCSPGIKQRHWNLMSRKVGFSIAPQETTSLSEILQLGLEKHLEELSQVSVQAGKEYALEQALEHMERDWEHVCFSFVPYRDFGVSVLAAVDDIQVLLEDHVVKTTTMKDSPFIAPFEEQLLSWEARLRLMQDVLESWLRVQMAWLYLEPIFGSEDIRNQIPVEGKLFEAVDSTWRQVMTEAQQTGNAMRVISQVQVHSKLKEAESMLDDIQRGLNDYLEKKRLFFPRFYFLSNDELLEILSETRDPMRVQPHLKKCFEGIAKLSFNAGYEITHMESAESERVELVCRIVPAQARGLVEQWLHQVERVMKESLQQALLRSITAYPQTPRHHWVLHWPGQVVLATSIIYWTLELSQAITQEGGLQSYLEKSNRQVEDIVRLVRGKLTKMERITLGALITVDVHARDVVAQLKELGVNTTTNFHWVAQLRYYWEEGRAVVRMITTSVPYGYEYLGNTSRLVITPLTDRCYRTLMGALQLNLGGAPEGPAGTGKTETCKDLAKAVAKQCVVFNCSDGLDYKAMGKFFKGLAQSGAWACFDEFNRIELEVLSVVAQQIQTIQRAVSERAESFVFEGTQISLDPSCTVFITMNPGYAGRAELPDNLKVLFRTVAMMVPDYVLIAEISLYAIGFVDARNLAAKIVATYRLCSEQLSSQHHYDYGMRAVKSVLTAAGNLKVRLPEEREDVLMLRSINDVNLPKFLSQDIPLFESIVSDLFPGVELPAANHCDMETAIREVAQRCHLQAVPWFITKILQVYEMMQVRHGFMLVGGPLGGKSSALRVLSGVLALLEERGLREEHRVDRVIINPKAVSMAQLYGSYDAVSHEWSDGVLANVFRKHATSPTPDRKWCVFDGPVDAVWVENMNTVLDDNKKLCLMSGEIIQMSPQQNIIFEVLDLEQASPATVSRCGMIYMEPMDLGWEPLVQSWLETKLPHFLTSEQKHLVKLLCEWLLPPCLDFIQKRCRLVVQSSPMHLTSALLKLYQCLLAEISVDSAVEREEACVETLDEQEKSFQASKQKQQEETSSMIVAGAFFSVVWSLGGLLDASSKQRFSEFFKSLCDQDSKQPHPRELRIPRALQMPKRDSVFHYVFLRRNVPSWYLWRELLAPASLEPCMKTGDKGLHLQLSDIIVATTETTVQKYFLEKLLLRDKPLLFVGPTGTGKTAITNSFLGQLPPEKYSVCQLSFSAQTSASQVQDVLLTKLERHRKGVYGAPPGRRVLLFVDDLSMPTKERYGAQPPIELLRQCTEHGYCFDRKDSSMLHIQDTSIVVAMAPPSGGRQAVTPRFLRHFNVISIDAFSEDTMKSIFQPVMDWHFNRGFENSLKRYSRILVWATTEVYTQTVLNFLPTPSKSHYTFNLRDFSRVIQGLLLLPSEVLPEGSDGVHKLMRLWIHEVHRVFADRLVDDKDRKLFFQLVKGVVQSQFKEKMPSLFGHMVIGRDVQEEDMRGLFFGDYLSPRNTEGAPRHYDEIQDSSQLKQTMERYLEEFNVLSKAPMNLVMFQFAIEHISRLSRVFKQPGGHALLIGIGGSGRQSVTRLAAFMAELELFQVKVQRSYSVSEWREDLRHVLRGVGQNGTPTVFLFADHQIKDESFLEDINTILNSGDIPNLFDKEEWLEIIEKMQQLSPVEDSRGSVSPASLYSLFTQLIRSNLHMALAFSPIGEAFRNRLRCFPALLTCCTIDWFQAWPEDALEKVAYHFLDDVEMSQEVRSASVFMCKHFHQSVVTLSQRFFESLQRRTYVTPTSYLELIKTFKSLLESKRLELLTSKNRYLVGLDKLDFAAAQIALMQEELRELKPLLMERSKETAELLTVIADETLEVGVVKREVEADEATANRAAQEAKAIKEECEQKLSIAMPALNAAITALDTLKASDITLLKTMQNPPSGVRITLAAICILKGIKPEKKVDPNGRSSDDYWPSAKKMLGDMKFLESLKEFDKDNIPHKVIAQIRRDLISNPEFQPSVIKNVSSACEGLCSWVRAIEVYDKVAKIVAPKRQRLEAAEAELGVQMEKLGVTRAELAVVSTKLAGLQEQLSQKLLEKRSLEESIELTKLKLERAEKLISGLGGEKERWLQISQQLQDTYQNIVGDVLLSAGLVAYLGPFTPHFRQEVLKEWSRMCKQKEIPVSPNFSLSATLGDPVSIMEWQLYGLPRDTFSVENAIIVTCSRRWPLMIDPQGQANKWLKNMEKLNKLHVCKASDPDYLRTLGNCIQFGTPMLLENLSEELDPVLEPLMLRQTFKHNGVEYLRLGESTIQYSHDFRLYLTTRLRNPHYLPEVSVKVTLLNFMITQMGLEDQLLSIVAAEEKPELEESKNQLYLEGARNRKQLKEIEDQILEVLSLSQGNILEDERAINILSSSRKLSQEILEKQEITTATEREIDDTRDGYRPVANHSSVLFFVISDLANIDPMYQYSLAWFINLYINSITQSERSTLLHERISNLNTHFTYSVYQNVCRSLFEKHKMLFSFLLCVGLQRNRGRVDEAEWRFLLTGGVALENPYSNPAPAWLKGQSWGELVRLSTLTSFSSLRKHFCSNVAEWKKIYDASHPNELPLPDPWEDLLTAFQRLLVLRCIRPDKIIPAAQQFIIDHMGAPYIEPPTFDLQRSYRDSSHGTPLVFLLSPGADPMAILLRFAEEQGMAGALQTISLGQGQGPIARRMIQKGVAEGTWVVLQNCHLAASWLPELEQICQELIPDRERTQPGFRLWLTSYPSADFPVSILQDGIKMTNEPPKGLRANLLRSYLSDPISDPAFYRGCSKPQEWERMLFGLCFFHGLVQERRMFGSLGWNIPYEFNEFDLRISARQVQMFLNEYSEVPLQALTYLTGECNYGGRVTDEFDRRLLLSLLATFYNQELLSHDDHPLSSSGVYRVPLGRGIHSYLEYIRSLPLNASPEVFGLHENGNITKEHKETRELFEGILATLPREQRYPICYSESMNTVLVQELLRFSRLTGTVRSSLQDLGRALRGQLLLSTELEDMFNSIIMGKVPAMWLVTSYPSLKPLGSYISDLLLRLQFFRDWIDRGAPAVFWISGFFFTQCFLTGVLQNHARKYHVPIDHLGFQFHVMDPPSTRTPPSPLQVDGVFIQGLFIEGARWDQERRTIAESLPKVLFESLPIIWLKPSEKSSLKESSTYACPVYKTSVRRGLLSTTGHSTNYVLTIQLPSERPQNHWINRGVACLCQLDY
ncbi:dynein heavy chain 3, axonemal-like isoform X2 [Polyodon spathula]|uniref:dynein heavy chain 3, axonemal-like isoform X2 n=1 Tax=Polyodon spathula TaxID=7913 RepID=UPI001B7DDB6E|nr:dynein heavy chain 3, axonemal-like isoform X2 [Polyodon spathula]